MHVKKENIMIFDAEYTAETEKERGIQELIQCAFKIIPAIFENNNIKNIELTSQYENSFYVKPKYNKQLSTYISSLTGIYEKDLEDAVNFDDTIRFLTDICNQYNITKILTWGPDKIHLKYNCNIIGIDKQTTRNICNKFIDIAPKISYILGFQTPLSQCCACELLNVEQQGIEHNATYDVQNLTQLLSKFCSTEGSISLLC